MRTHRSISIALVLAWSGILFASDVPPLVQVSTIELHSPLAVELQEPPATLGGIDDFRKLWRDPRFPTVLLRKHGAMYAAFRRLGPIPQGRSSADIPSDIVYFVGRPTIKDILGVWPDAVQSERVSHAIDLRLQAEPARETRIIKQPEKSGTPRMAHQPTRVRRLASIADRYTRAE